MSMENAIFSFLDGCGRTYRALMRRMSFAVSEKEKAEIAHDVQTILEIAAKYGATLNRKGEF